MHHSTKGVEEKHNLSLSLSGILEQVLLVQGQ